MTGRRVIWLAAVLAALGCGTAAGGGGATAPGQDTVAAVDTVGVGGDGDGQATPDTAVDPADTAAEDVAAEDVAAQDVAAQDVAAQEVAAPEPCGNTVGKVLCDVGLQGYIRNETTGLATESEYQDGFNLAEVMAKTTQTYAVIVVGAWW